MPHQHQTSDFLVTPRILAQLIPPTIALATSFHANTSALVSDQFHQCTSSAQVEQIAESEVAILSGILKLAHRPESI
jgi:hypothetical protein